LFNSKLNGLKLEFNTPLKPGEFSVYQQSACINLFGFFVKVTQNIKI